MKKIRIATRKSPLALWQAAFIKSQLQIHHPNLQISLIKLSTRGDEILGTSLSRIGGKGLFIKELEKSMLDDNADIAVHSLKDMPYSLPNGFEIGAILKRENPFDAFVSNKYSSLEDLPIGAKVGTCSNRRIVQIKNIRPDLKILDLRGNVNTRLKKLDNNEYDCIILACAGLIRLGLKHRITQQINPIDSLPAVGQGAIAIEIRKDAANISKLLSPLIDIQTTLATSAEREMNKQLKGSCASPIAGFATIAGNTLIVNGLVGNIANNIILKANISGQKDNAIQLGKSLAELLLNKGAKKLLQPASHP